MFQVGGQKETLTWDSHAMHTYKKPGNYIMSVTAVNSVSAITKQVPIKVIGKLTPPYAALLSVGLSVGETLLNTKWLNNNDKNKRAGNTKWHCRDMSRISLSEAEFDDNNNNGNL